MPEDPARILIVDDEPLNLDVLQQELEDRGYDVELAEDGQEALDRVAASAPDLILMDVIMPRLDGIEACRILKQDPQTALIPVIIMTALSAVEDRVRGIEAGADDFLSKPVDDRELMARIETALRTKKAIDRTREELQSATDQLSALGSVDQDVTILALADHDSAGRAAVVVEDAGGIPADLTGDRVGVLFADPDPTAHTVAAIAAADRLGAAGLVVGLESGSALVSSRRVDGEEGSTWKTLVEGPSAAVAADLLEEAAPAQVLIGPEAARRAEGRMSLTRVLGSEAHTPGGDAERPPAGAPTILTWPADYQALRQPMVEAWQIEDEIYLTRSLSGGKSGARVYLVDITCQGFSGQAILKLDRAPDPTWEEQDEAERHRRAYEANPTYSEAHLPRIVQSLVHEGLIATLSTVAGRGLEYILPWAQVDYDRQVSSGSSISRGILADWNRDYRLSDPVMPHQLIDDWLTYRLDPEEGRIAPFARSLAIDPHEPSFIHEGHWYPNPYAFALGGTSMPPRSALRAARGMIHGDLHGFNVLMQAQAGEEDYYVIDVAFFEEDSFLMYDNAYLELAYLLHTRENVSPGRWISLTESVQGRGTPTGDDFGLLQIATSIRSGVRDWIDQTEPNRLGYMESQHALARVAVGLNFVNKRVSAEMKLLAFLYAAVNLKAYLKLQAIDWPRSGSVLTVGD